MTATETQTRWGIPDWTRPEDYPSEATDAVWRWEFLRRRPDYRVEWERGQDIIDQGGILTAVTADHEAVMLRFGVAVIYDPRKSFDHGVAWHLFRPPHGFVVRYDPRRRDGERLVDYRFDITRPLEPQIAKARTHLLGLQSELHGERNTPKPRRQNWPLFLRALDARDCGAGWSKIGRSFWPHDSGDVKQKARDTHNRACAVRDNFPI